MIVEISCELYARMAQIPLGLDEADTRTNLKCLFIERRDNRIVIFGTNTKIAAAEFIGIEQGPDESMTIIADAALVQQCINETQYGSKLTIADNPALGFVSVRTTFGFNYPGNAHVQQPPTSDLYHWRDIVPDEMPKKNNGAMYWATDEVSRLSDASPSGQFVLPAFIDVQQVIIVRDTESVNWFGMFIAKKPNENVKPATLPDWVK